MATMQALKWDGSSLSLEAAQTPLLQPSEAIIKVDLAGVCNTDLEIMRGYYSFKGTLGHEFVGTVFQASDDSLIGKRVVADINFSCHTCSMCLAGHPHHCLQRKTLGINQEDGAFAEYLSAPISNLVMVPDAVADENAVFAEPLAAALEILEQVDISRIDEVAIIGDGKLGLLIAMCMRTQDLKVSLIGRHPEKYALLNDPEITYYTVSPDKKFPLVVEATGQPQGFHEAINLTRAKGTLVLKSTYADSFKFNPVALVVNEITLLGSRCGPMDKAITLMTGGHISPRCLIDESFELSQGLEALAKAGQKGALKILIKP